MKQIGSRASYLPVAWVTTVQLKISTQVNRQSSASVLFTPLVKMLGGVNHPLFLINKSYE